MILPKNNNMSSLFRKVITFMRKDFFSDISNTFSFLERWLGVIRTVLLFYFFSKFLGVKSRLPLYEGDYFSYVLIGIATVSYLNAPMRGLADTICREGWLKTLEVLISTPTKMRVFFLAFIPYNIFMGFLAAGLHILLGAFLRLNLSAVNYLSVFVVMFLATIIFLSFGIMSASFWIAFRKTDPVIWLVSNLFWLLGGVYFPITIFPKALQKVCFFIPTTYIFRSLRLAFLKNYSVFALKYDLFILLIFSCIFTALSVFSFKKALNYARTTGIIAL